MKRSIPFVVAACVILLFELVARLVTSSFPEPPIWPTNVMNTHVDLMDQKMEVAFVGSSVVLDGIDPRVFDHLTDQVSYNAAIPLGQFDSIEVWTTEVVIPRLDPSIVIVGVTSRGFNQLDDQFFEALVDSPGLRMFSPWRSTWLDSVEDRMRSMSDLVKYRSLFRNPDRLIAVLRGGHMEEQVPLTERGQRIITETEFRVRNEWDPRTSHLLDFQMDEIQMNALSDLLTDVVHNGTRAIVVSMPVHSSYLQLHDAGEFERFNAMVCDLAAGLDVPFLDLHSAVPDAYFWDAAHLIPEGSELLTELLVGQIDEAGLETTCETR